MSGLMEIHPPVPSKPPWTIPRQTMAPMVGETFPFDARTTQERPFSFTIPTRDQILAQLNAICPICGHNDHVALQMMLQMRQFLNAHKVGQEKAVDVSPINEPIHHTPNTVGKIAGYAKAKAQYVLKGPAPAEVSTARLSVCAQGGMCCPKCGEWADFNVETMIWWCNTTKGGKGCDWTEPMSEPNEKTAPCPFRSITHAGVHCTKCGCGRNEESDLRHKSTMLEATCPRDIWPRQIKKGQVNNGGN